MIVIYNQPMKGILKQFGRKTKRIIKLLPEHKHYLDVVIAMLSIPVLVTAIILNYNNLQPKKTSTTNPTPPVVVVHSNPQVIVPTQAVQVVTQQVSPQPTSATCTNGIGTLDISYPQEGQQVSDSPLCIQVDYNAGNYCQVVWRYRINGGNWSDYGNNSVCLYTLPNGQNTFQLQVKSLSSTNTETLTRTFIYQGTLSPTPQSASSSAH